MSIKRIDFKVCLGLILLWIVPQLSVNAAPQPVLDGKANLDADSIAPPDRKDVFAQGLKELELAETRIRLFPDSVAPHVDRLRILFVLGVKEEKYLTLGAGEIEFLKKLVGRDAKTQNLVLGYTGAIHAVQAKHGFNLKRKWKNLEMGLPILDSAVARDPNQSELRYLRLVNNYYLPFFLGRKSVVTEDFTVLAKLLPLTAEQYPAKWFINVANFVLENGKLQTEERSALAQKIRQVSDLARAQGLQTRSDK